MATRMLQRRATAAEWAALNPVLSSGEIGFETDSKIFKLGDGETPWNDLVGPFIHRTGGSMLGPLTLIAPTDATHAARKLDVDAHANLTSTHQATNLPTASRMVLRDAGGRARFGTPTHADDAANKAYADARVAKSGDTMAGHLTLSLAPSADAHAARMLDVRTAAGNSGFAKYLELANKVVAVRDTWEQWGGTLSIPWASHGFPLELTATVTGTFGQSVQAEVHGNDHRQTPIGTSVGHSGTPGSNILIRAEVQQASLGTAGDCDFLYGAVVLNVSRTN
jgi:hypothetical protein